MGLSNLVTGLVGGAAKHYSLGRAAATALAALTLSGPALSPLYAQAGERHNRAVSDMQRELQAVYPGTGIDVCTHDIQSSPQPLQFRGSDIPFDRHEIESVGYISNGVPEVFATVRNDGVDVLQITAQTFPDGSKGGERVAGFPPDNFVETYFSCAGETMDNLVRFYDDGTHGDTQADDGNYISCEITSTAPVDPFAFARSAQGEFVLSVVNAQKVDDLVAAQGFHSNPYVSTFLGETYAMGVRSQVDLYDLPWNLDIAIQQAPEDSGLDVGLRDILQDGADFVVYMNLRRAFGGASFHGYVYNDTDGLNVPFYNDRERYDGGDSLVSIIYLDTFAWLVLPHERGHKSGVAFENDIVSGLEECTWDAHYSTIHCQTNEGGVIGRAAMPLEFDGAQWIAKDLEEPFLWQKDWSYSDWDLCAWGQMTCPDLYMVDKGDPTQFIGPLNSELVSRYGVVGDGPQPGSNFDQTHFETRIVVPAVLGPEEMFIFHTLGEHLNDNGSNNNYFEEPLTETKLPPGLGKSSRGYLTEGLAINPELDGEDNDEDGVNNFFDNCPTSYNPNQVDDDEDGIGDECPEEPPTNEIFDDGFEETGDTSKWSSVVGLRFRV